ncbi:MAG: NAD(+)/NADH kinase [Desulfobacterales bacterium]|nr:MAG: NAD(+)/NADH kinase [Desulfobacterales bacterium]
MRKVGLFVKKDAKACRKADEFEAWLRARKVEVVRKTSSVPSLRTCAEDSSCAPPDLFCVFVLGGDGTFLSAVRWIGNSAIPVLGVKFGEVGFLAETVEENLIKAAENILHEKYAISLRMRLDVKLIRKDEEFVHDTVLNDVVINRGALARLANIETYINDHYLTTYRADGLIVATPTGSTAYSLAAGGPVIHPEVPGIIMTPICPFTLTNRPLIVPNAARIKIRLEKGSSDIMLTFDGQQGLEISDRDTILVQKGSHPLNMITIPGKHYYDVLKAKLRWSGGRV